MSRLKFPRCEQIRGLVFFRFQGPPKTLTLLSGANKSFKLSQVNIQKMLGASYNFRTLDDRKSEKARAEKPSRLVSSSLENLEYGINVLKQKAMNWPLKYFSIQPKDTLYPSPIRLILTPPPPMVQ